MKKTNVFKRKEIKYLITKEQKEALKKIMEKHMQEDPFGNSTIRNIYYDTPDKLLIRRSISKPEYKEKLRVRSYKRADGDSKVFIEIKKKYKGIVYKRRMALEEKLTKDYLAGDHSISNSSQISKEINYFIKYYGDLQPAIFLAYDREAFFSKEDPNFRMTLDENVIIRDYDISLSSPVYGEDDMLNGKVILEVKTAMGIPAWLLNFFSENKIYKTSFSKYGNAYIKYLLPKHLDKKKALAMKKEDLKERVSNNKVKKNKKILRANAFKKAGPLLAASILYLSIFLNYQFKSGPSHHEAHLDLDKEVISLEADSLKDEGIMAISVADLIDLLSYEDDDIGAIISSIDRQVTRGNLLDISLSELMDKLEKNNLDLDRVNKISEIDIKATDIVSLLKDEQDNNWNKGNLQSYAIKFGVC